MKNIVLLVFFVVFGLVLTGQDGVELITTGAEIDGQISSDDREKIFKSVEALLIEFEVAGSMLSEKDKRVTQKSVKRYQSMFRPGAMVVNDIHEFIDQDLVSAEDYSLGVFNNLKLTGVEFRIEKAELMSLSIDGTGYYTPYVKVTKVLYNYLNTSGTEKKSVSGIRIEQKFFFDIYKDDLSKVTISKIDHVGEFLPAAEETNLVGMTVGLGSSSFNTTTSSYWDREHRSSPLEPKGGLNYSVGVEYLSDKFISKKGSPKRLFAWSIGLRYASYQMKTDLMSFSISDFDQVANDPALNDNDTQTYIRHVGPVDVIEEIRFNTIEIPLGINYNLTKTQNNTVYIGLKYTTSIVLGSSGTLEGEGLYDGTYYVEDPSVVLTEFGSEADFVISRDVPSDQPNSDEIYEIYRTGRKPLNFDTDADLASTVSSLVISPTGYFNFTDNSSGWGYMIALDLGLQFGSFLNHAPINDIEDEAFKYDDDFNGSLLNYYADDLSALNFGLRFGVFHRLSN